MTAVVACPCALGTPAWAHILSHLCDATINSCALCSREVVPLMVAVAGVLKRITSSPRVFWPLSIGPLTDAGKRDDFLRQCGMISYSLMSATPARLQGVLLRCADC